MSTERLTSDSGDAGVVDGVARKMLHFVEFVNSAKHHGGCLCGCGGLWVYLFYQRIFHPIVKMSSVMNLKQYFVTDLI